MTRSNKELLRKCTLPALFAGILASFICGFIYNFGVSIKILGFVGASYFFAQKYFFNDDKFFVDLFLKFNSRFEALSIDLNKEDVSVLFIDQYINLCSEEFLMYQKGYIPEVVWASWVDGMFFYFSKAKFSKVLEDRFESEGDSYYGFCKGTLEKEHIRLKSLVTK